MSRNPDDIRELRIVPMFICASPDEDTRKAHGVTAKHPPGPCCKPTPTPKLYSFGNDKDRR